ncbi:hypothetical protein [Nonomuraea africana]|uniref:Uncharacterized protein n=1 Tax=Nonomuraea africana TaxID=46171 RepID=A0ABR9K5K4_9ACTN|nr:hypothetical protein [Nonomuraea africana]MBE1557285.1 hypothetical protein [Nonomuraea africana]
MKILYGTIALIVLAQALSGGLVGRAAPVEVAWPAQAPTLDGVASSGHCHLLLAEGGRAGLAVPEVKASGGTAARQ